MEKKQIDKIDLLHSKIDSLQKVIKRLKQEKEDLKCCGNCGKYPGEAYICGYTKERMHCWEKCTDQWEKLKVKPKSVKNKYED